MNKKIKKYNRITLLLWNIFLQSTCVVLLGSEYPFLNLPNEIKQLIIDYY